MSGDGFDAVVVGSGPNGLVGALVLARAGCRVLLLEAADRVGGALRTEELTLPGFRHDVGATVVPLALASPAFRALDPERLGVRWAHPPVPLGHPLDPGADPQWAAAVLIERDLDHTAQGLGRDGAAWRRLIGSVARGGLPLVDALLSPLSVRAAARTAPALARYGVSGLLPAQLLGRLGFRTEAARALFAGLAGHSVLSLRSPGTAGYGTFMGALAHLVGWPVVAGGSENLALALASELRARGGEIRTGTRVAALREIPPARYVLLDVTPRQLLALGGDELPARYRRGLARFRYGPGVFKLDWALDGPVPWRDERLQSAGTVHLGASAAEIAASEAAVAAGRCPDRPYVICVQPTVADPSRAPDGKHVLWAYCHVPNGCDRDMSAVIEDQLERFAPGFRERVLARHTCSPVALEAFDENLVGGDIGGGSAALDQFVARPVWSTQPWRVPLSGTYLCSSSTPPGGGVHGMGGWHSAHLALRS